MTKANKEKIVFLDAATLDFGDVSLDAIRCLGRLSVYPRTTPAQIYGRVRNAAIVITNKCRFDHSLLGKLPHLKCLSICATGTNNVDLEAARERKIAVTNVAGYSTASVVQCTFAFLLALAGGLRDLDRAAHQGAWSRSPFFLLAPVKIIEIEGKTLGILGYGAIGRKVAAVARAFGMRVIVGKIPGRRYLKGHKTKRVSFETMVRDSDFITIHAPLTPLTRGLFDDRVLKHMKKGAYLINMARGGIVDEPALRRSLESGYLAGAASDVLTEEPPSAKHVLLEAPNLLLTPHVAWASREARVRLIQEIALNIEAFLKGKRRNRVD